ncbi:ATP-binding protein [Geodermatophilus sp. CPCC 206100]|uniref:ATP-binding protein n=1 Tax=Geodermatophilus sp. CPCC 206100 TaxID=3020054 RepID=UPI003B00D7A3
MLGKDFTSPLTSEVLDPGMRLEMEPNFVAAALQQGRSHLADAWLAVALSHKSWLYENVPTEGPNGHLVDALAGLGSDVLRFEILMHLDRTEPQATLERRHRSLERFGVVLEHLAMAMDISSLARLGLGEARQAEEASAAGRQPSAYSAVATQCLGWWSVFGNQAALHKIVSAAIEKADKTTDYSNIKTKTLIDVHFRAFMPVYSYQASGPDHARTFIAELRLTDGRSGTGAGVTKKAAAGAAALDLLARHAPEHLAVASPKEDIKRAEDAVRRVGRHDADRYKQLAAAFGCRIAENFALALTHRSWTYEQHPVDLDAGSNTVLAHAGRIVFDLSFRRLRVMQLLTRSVSPTATEASPRNAPDEEMATLFAVLDIPSLVRLGQGQRQLGMTKEIKATCAQALYGAAILEHRYIDRLERALPDVLIDSLHGLASIELIDAHTKLVGELAPLGVELHTVSFTEFGLRHANSFEAVLALIYEGRTVQLRGDGNTKRHAKKDAAQQGLAALATLSGDAVPAAAAKDAVELLIRAQVGALTSRRDWQRWLDRGSLGGGLLAQGRHDDFRIWARTTVELLNGWSPTHDEREAVREYYDFARTAEPRPLFTTELRKLLSSVDTLASTEALTAASLSFARRSVRHLSAAHAVHLATGENALLADVIDDWLTLSRRTLTVTKLDETTSRISARSAAALGRILAEAGEALTGGDGPRPLAVEVSIRNQHGGVTIDVKAPVGWTFPQRDAEGVELVLEAAPAVRMQLLGSDILSLSVVGDDEDNWLVSLSSSSPGQAYEQELARVLHDLKNQLTAASIALATPATTRTDRLAKELEVSRHLDVAASLGSRLKAARLDLTGEDLVGEVEIDGFLRSYSASLLQSLPQHIHLVTPRAACGATARLSAEALSAALDNLIRNAVEALPEGGVVTIDAIATEEEVILEVADSGPGVPSTVLEALSANRVAVSTKREGSGLGLASVQRLLARVGGYLDWTTGPSGHRWQVVAPVVGGPA